MAKIHFDDDFRFRRAYWWILLALEAAQGLAWMVLVERRLPGLARVVRESVWVAGARVIPVLLVLDALFRVYVGARADLVESRLRLRYVVLALSGGYVLLVLLGEGLLLGTRTRLAADLGNAAGLYVLVVGVQVFLLKVDQDFLGADRAARPAPPCLPSFGRSSACSWTKSGSTRRKA